MTSGFPPGGVSSITNAPSDTIAQRISVWVPLGYRNDRWPASEHYLEVVRGPPRSTLPRETEQISMPHDERQRETLRVQDANDVENTGANICAGSRRPSSTQSVDEISFQWNSAITRTIRANSRSKCSRRRASSFYILKSSLWLRFLSFFFFFFVPPGCKNHVSDCGGEFLPLDALSKGPTNFSSLT